MSQAAKDARERELAAYMHTLTPDDIKRENAFRTAQRKAGKSGKAKIQDPNAPHKPLSAYFLFLQKIHSDPELFKEVFGDETETTKQCVLAAAKWRSMADDERKVRTHPSRTSVTRDLALVCSRLVWQPFLAKAEQDKLEYEVACKSYESGLVTHESNPGIGTTSLSDGQHVPVPMASPSLFDWYDPQRTDDTHVPDMGGGSDYWHNSMGAPQSYFSNTDEAIGDWYDAMGVPQLFPPNLSGVATVEGGPWSQVSEDVGIPSCVSPFIRPAHLASLNVLSPSILLRSNGPPSPSTAEALAKTADADPLRTTTPPDRFHSEGSGKH